MSRDKLIDIWWAKLENGGYAHFDYDDLVNSMGVSSLAVKSFGSYQGDLVYLVEEDAMPARRGVIVIGYGSCSGCDALEATPQPGSYYDKREDKMLTNEDFRPVIELRDSLKKDIIWPDEGKTLLETIEAGIKENDWWRFDDEIAEYVREIAAEDFMAEITEKLIEQED